ncbi:MAG: NAD-dependent epimerase/dehydratase family protein [Actinomycetota bacterium]|nr:NAD-dependent epimerase/dehydratase family protein [Actinomycetota bacterium]
MPDGTNATGLTVAITGPTGALGKSLVRLLEKTTRVGRVIGMARRPFNPSDLGWIKTEYRQGDILDAASVSELVEDADVVVHLAFIIMGAGDEAQRVNIEGSRNVFEAAIDNKVPRLIYTSSVAAYGFHDDNPDVLDESIPPRGTDEHYYSAQKAAVETMLRELEAPSTDVYVFRPCIVAGAEATELIENIPFVQLGEKLPKPVRSLVRTIPLLRPVIPDPGIPFQLVHVDDVARALRASIFGKGEPGVYNLAAEGEVTLSDLAHALGWYAMPVPELTVDVTAKIVSRLPLMPARASWINALRVPVLMDCTRAREKLGWDPEYDALDTLADTIAGARQKGLPIGPAPVLD